MSRILAVLVAACAGGLPVLPHPAAAQRWNEPDVLALVQRATERRTQQLADTGLTDYRADARGYLTFLAQLGEGFTEPPKVVKADELALEVYWRAPNLSKQRIVGRRDTLMLPTDINYHRDHLGIVQNNFPDIIRLGDGDEVQDVPHPLSAMGLGEYDFAISDSLQIRLADRDVSVYQVRVRPKADDAPRVIGALYIERGDAQVVRMAFNFTRAAYKDKQLEDLAIVVENGLIDGRFWLPRRQEIEIRRAGSWMDYPARGIIRGRWEICCYQVNVGLDPALFRGPEIVSAPARILGAHPWTGAILDSLPEDVRAVTADDVRQVQEEARELVRAEALQRARSTSLSARGVSDFVRVNRVEGLALGAGVTRRLGAGFSGAVRGRYGLDDRALKGTVTLAWQRASGAAARVAVSRDHRDVGDEPETSLLRNSIAAQEFGSDYTDPYEVRGVALSVQSPMTFGAAWTLTLMREAQRRLEVHATPARGDYRATVPAWATTTTRASLRGERPTRPGWFGTEVSGTVEVRAGSVRARDTILTRSRPYFGRASAALRVERPSGRQRVVVHAAAAAVRGVPVAPPQELVYAGGPSSGPGYEYHAFVGLAAGHARLEWRAPVPFVAIPLGRFGRAPASATLAPFAQIVYLDGSVPASALRSGVYPSVGLGTLVFFELLRVDVARGLRQGRWTMSVDVARELWRIL